MSFPRKRKKKWNEIFEQCCKKKKKEETYLFIIECLYFNDSLSTETIL